MRKVIEPQEAMASASLSEADWQEFEKYLDGKLPTEKDNGESIMRHDQEWTYKNHTCVIELEYEDDCIKAWHYVTMPNGTKRTADLTPYDRSRRIVELWIDAGYPPRQGVGPLHQEDLEKMIQ